MAPPRKLGQGLHQAARATCGWRRVPGRPGRRRELEQHGHARRESGDRQDPDHQAGEGYPPSPQRRQPRGKVQAGDRPDSQKQARRRSSSRAGDPARAPTRNRPAVPGQRVSTPGNRPPGPRRARTAASPRKGAAARVHQPTRCRRGTRATGSRSPAMPPTSAPNRMAVRTTEVRVSAGAAREVVRRRPLPRPPSENTVPNSDPGSPSPVCRPTRCRSGPPSRSSPPEALRPGIRGPGGPPRSHGSTADRFPPVPGPTTRGAGAREGGGPCPGAGSMGFPGRARGHPRAGPAGSWDERRDDGRRR